MTTLAREADTATAAKLARHLGKNYFTIAKALQRLRGGLACALSWNLCSECGAPIVGSVSRTCHAGCERARTARKARERRHEGRPGAKSTPYVIRFRQEQPERARALREREKAMMRKRWPDLPADVRAANLEKLHTADERDYAVTLPQAVQSGARWDEDEDRIVLAALGTPAREVALELGRTLWAVRGRRVRLKQREEARDD